MLPSLLHQIPYFPYAETLVCLEVATLCRPFEVESFAVEQPRDFEPNTRLDQVVEMAVGVLESECIRVWEE
jgi:hypothetical protein